MECNIGVVEIIVKCMEKGNLYGPMEGNTLENIVKIRNMDMGIISAQMEGVELDNGKMGSDMGKEFLLTKRE